MTADPIVLAIDAGNSKTDVALATASGELLAWVRGGGFHPHGPNLPTAIALLADLVRQAVREADLVRHAAQEGDLVRHAAQEADSPAPKGPYVADHVAAFLAHCDLPVEQELLHAAITAQAWAPEVTVDNDTFAILRAGSGRPYGVAVVCGGGMNCVARSPTGQLARYPAFGRRSGDWGGGDILGEEVLWWAVRDEDGRGPRTALRQAVAAHFGREDVTSVCIAFHLREFDEDRLYELVPVLFETAETGDAVAVALVERLGDEVAAMASAAMGRLEWGGVTVPVVLGGGILAAADPRLLARVRRGLPGADLRILEAPPILGSVLHGLDRLGAITAETEHRLRKQFSG